MLKAVGGIGEAVGLIGAALGVMVGDFDTAVDLSVSQNRANNNNCLIIIGEGTLKRLGPIFF